MHPVENPTTFTATELVRLFQKNIGDAILRQVDYGLRLDDYDSATPVKRADMEYYRGEGADAWGRSILQIVVHPDRTWEILKGAHLIPWFAMAIGKQPSNAALWWQQKQAKEAAARQKVADLHKEIRDYLGDPS